MVQSGVNFTEPGFLSDRGCSQPIFHGWSKQELGLRGSGDRCSLESPKICKKKKQATQCFTFVWTDSHIYFIPSISLCLFCHCSQLVMRHFPYSLRRRDVPSPEMSVSWGRRADCCCSHLQTKERADEERPGVHSVPWVKSWLQSNKCGRLKRSPAPGTCWLLYRLVLATFLVE